jgi:hypothetical protein
MAHHASRIGRVFFVRWNREMTITDCLGLPREVEEARHGAGGRIVFVSIVPADMAVPTSEARKAFSKAVDKMKEHCEAVFVVIEGTGLIHATLRSVLTAWTLATRTQSLVTVYDSVEKALQEIARRLSVDAGELLKAAKLNRMVA